MLVHTRLKGSHQDDWFPKLGLGSPYELLLHFDAVTGFLKDSSAKNHHVSNIPFGTGSIVSGSSIPSFSQGAVFNQQFPGSGTVANYNKHSTLSVDDIAIPFSNSEFLITALITVAALPTNEYGIFASTEAVSPGSGNRTGISLIFTSDRFTLECLNNGAGFNVSVFHASFASEIIGRPFLLTVSRRKRTGNTDVVCLYINERLFNVQPCADSFSIGAGVKHRMYIGTWDTSTDSTVESTRGGFQGTIDEFCIRIGTKVTPASGTEGVVGSGLVSSTNTERWLAPWAPYPITNPYSNKGWNYFDRNSGIWLNNFGKDSTNDLAGTAGSRGVRAIESKASGLVYWEVKTNYKFNGPGSSTSFYVGIASAFMALNDRPFFGTPGGQYAAYRLNGQYGNQTAYIGSNIALTSGANVVGLVANFSTRTLSVYVNNVFSVSLTWDAGAPAMFPYACFENDGRFSPLTLALDSNEQTYSAPGGATPWLSAAPEVFYFVP